MEIFLKKVAQTLLEKHGGEFDRLTVVFPNRRAGVFFVNYLNGLVDHPIISPEITTINKLFTSLSAYFIPDRLNLIFRLYKIYRDLTATTESFDDFYYWGGMLVSDFDQVDKYLADANQLFDNITNLREIDERFSMLQPESKETLENFWKSVLTERRSANQEEFVRLWKDLSKIYTLFKASLHSEGLAYEGMAYRSVVENLSQGKPVFSGDKHYVFVGFNALDRCEEELFTALLNEKRAFFYWDYDRYYLDDPLQESGLFMRKNLEKYPQADLSLDYDAFTNGNKSVKILNVSSQVSQAQVAGEEIARIVSQKESSRLDDTAIVLCDEELLLPVISALPEEAQKINITMGFPLKMSAVYSLVTHLADLQRYLKNESGKINFYYKNVLAVLSNQLILSVYPEECRQLTAAIRKNNLVYLEEEALGQNELFRMIFSAPGNLTALADYLPVVLKQIFLFWKEKEQAEAVLVREYLYQAYLAVSRLKENILVDGVRILGDTGFISTAAFFRLTDQYLNETTVPFEGEPIEGLQIMGILETRVLDFRNLVILSVNDGIMPRIASSGSFIPYNLRRIYGLPAIEEQNAIYGYYFYRLLQRAEQVTLVYNSASGGLQTGEKSRYLYQLQMESPLKVTESSVVYPMQQGTAPDIVIPKDEKVLASLQKYLDGTRFLSPTALDKYLTCPLQFYFRFVAGLQEPEEIAEEVDHRIFGVIFHRCMETLYRPYTGKILDQKSVQRIMDDEALIDQTITAAFTGIYFKGVRELSQIQFSGKNWLIFRILKKYILRLLEIDRQRAPFLIEGLELSVEAGIALGESRKIRIGGVIDRLDRVNGDLLVLDYKTGKAELQFAMISALFDKGNKNRNKAAFQTLVYAYILYRNKPLEKAISPGIFYLRGLFDDKYEVSLRSKENGNRPVEFTAVAGQFGDELQALLTEIVDPSVPFTKTTLEENCSYCVYKQLCQK